MFNYSTYQQKIKNLLLFLMVFLTPSLFLFPKSEPFEYIKMWFLSNVMLVFILLKKKELKKFSTGNDKFLVLFFLILQTINLFFSTNFVTSFFGNFHHFSSSYIYVFSLCAFYLFLEKKDFKNTKVLKLVVVSSLFGIIYSILQILKLDFIHWDFLITTNRVFSTFGQPNLYAQYLGSVILICVYLFFTQKKFRYLLVSLIVFFIFFKTGSLSVFLSLAITIVITIFLNWRKMGLLTLLYILFSFLGLIFVTFFFNQERLISQIQGGNFRGEIITNDTAKIRFILWSETLKQVNLKRFFVGSGEETFGLNFVRGGVFNKTSEWQQVFNKPHNMFVEYLFEGGVINFVLLLTVFIYALLRIRRNVLYSIPFFIILSSSLLYTSVYSLFLIFLIFKLLSKNSFRYNIKPYNFITKLIFQVLIASFLILNNLFFVSLLLFDKYPCTSYKILKFIPQYQVECGIIRNDISLAMDGIKNGKGDRILEEKALIFFLQKNYLKESKNLITNWEIRNINDPVVIYYKGLYFEKIGEVEKANEEFKKADSLVPNFFVVKSKLRNY